MPGMSCILLSSRFEPGAGFAPGFAASLFIPGVLPISIPGMPGISPEGGGSVFGPVVPQSTGETLMLSSRDSLPR